MKTLSELPNRIRRVTTALAIALCALTISLRAVIYAPAAQTRTAPPATRLGELFSGWLDAFNSGDPEKIRAFQKDNFDASLMHDPEHRLQMDLSLRERTGGFELKNIDRSTATEISGLLKEKNSASFARLTMRLSGDSGRIAEFTLQLVPPPAGEGTQDSHGPGTKEGITVLAQEIDGKLTELTGRDEFSGVVLIAKDGKVLWQKAYGYEDREAKTPATVYTKFRLASMNKMFTSVAIGQLVEQGKLKYTDTVADVLPHYPNTAVAKKITIAQLLTHTSGLGDFFGPEFERKKRSLHLLRNYLPLFVNEPLAFAPGNGWQYSNAGYVVLGLIIEKLSGENYYEYVQRHIYDVAGMKDTGSTPITARALNIAVGYTRTDIHEPWRRNTDTLPWRASPAGGGESTVGDLLRFDQALRSHKLLSPELTNEVLSGKVHPPRLPEGEQYCYGFSEKLIHGERIVGHNGGAPGMNAQLDMHLKRGYTVVVLANRDPRIAEDWANYISNTLP